MGMGRIIANLFSLDNIIPLDDNIVPCCGGVNVIYFFRMDAIGQSSAGGAICESCKKQRQETRKGW